MRRLAVLLAALPLLAAAAPALAATAAPVKPYITTVSRAAGQVTIYWSDSGPDAQSATSFRLLRGPDAAHLALLATTTTKEFTDPDTADSLRVYAVESVNDAGTSPQSNPWQVDAATRAPGDFTGTVTASQVSLSWSGPTGMPADPITGYAVFRGATAAALTQVATTDVSPWSGPAPAAGVHAYFQVAAVLQPGTLGPRSDVVDLTGVNTQLVIGRDDRIDVVPLSGGPGTTILYDGQLHPDIAVSPNGTMVAYTTTNGDSNRQLWVRRVDGTGTPTAIMTDPGRDARSPTWNGGSQLAYAIDTDKGITIIRTPVAPGQVSTAYPAEWWNLPFDEPSWASNSGVVATDVRSESAPLVTLDRYGVAKPIAGTAGGYTPIVSPDTAQVAFLVPGAADFTEIIKVVNLQTGAVRTLPAPDGMLFSAPTWTRDMSALYVVGGDDTSTRLYRIGLGAGGTTTTVPGITDPWAVSVSTPDLVGPVKVQLGGIPAVTLNSTVTPTFSASDALNKIGAYELHFHTSNYSRSLGGYTRTFARPTAISLTPGWWYCFWVVAIDRAGNRSAATPQQCMTVPMDDRALARSSGFTAVANRAYYAGTAMKATAKGQTLTRTGMTSIRQVTVVASACPTCGIVDVLFNGAKIGSINTVSATTVNRKVFTLPAFSVRSGTVTLKVASSGKQVFIDGLGFKK